MQHDCQHIRLGSGVLFLSCLLKGMCAMSQLQLLSHMENDHLEEVVITIPSAYSGLSQFGEGSMPVAGFVVSGDVALLSSSMAVIGSG